MNRKQLEQYFKKYVKIKLFDGEEIEGYLRKSGEDDFKNNPDLFIPKNYYFLVDKGLNYTSCLFKVSHIRKIEIM
ncbi:hypothetical protein [Clostridium butyricum]|uniref:hypothetical protein n=1 Tax=Clostridium butyricum TaxID=1492 RepID=UPI000903B476|nr:hypothetical protein [Clostridium butyricum]APF21624.1 hypothetical protein NPD4_3510 [Clostridium butyricum]